MLRQTQGPSEDKRKGLKPASSGLERKQKTSKKRARERKVKPIRRHQKKRYRSKRGIASRIPRCAGEEVSSPEGKGIGKEDLRLGRKRKTS